MDSGINIGRVFNIQFRVHYSWVFIFALITVFLVWQVFPYAVPGETRSTHWIMSIVTSLLFFLSILVHETAHSLIGRANGIPVRSITLYLFGGAAQMDREPASPGAEIKMAIAGPLASFLLAALFWIVYDFYISQVLAIAAVALWLAQINLIVAVFNLLPGFPLDGGRVLRGIWWHVRDDYPGATRGAILFGRIVGVLVGVSGLYFVIVHRDWLAGIWLVLLGWYLESTARTSLKQFELQIWLKKHTVADVIRRDCPRISRDTSLKYLHDKYPDRHCFVIPEIGEITGIVWFEAKDATLPETTVADLVIPLDQTIAVETGDNLLEVVQRMNETGSDIAVAGGQSDPVGFVFLDDLVNLVNRHADNQGAGDAT
ncbi:MAG: site-2 protease family protein [Dehalogenimonas sp.]|uniref:Zinc metalloprotease n=1 Tax=Candidatus Dehalogenimonas loeffleri TaxID=3127115 RepID=A0ABZ2J768_9CHLR|nr:site-2 protease family protein [Dehalogenimonas sp.]